MSGSANTMKMAGTRDAFGEAIVELGKENKKIVVIDADLAESTRTHRFKETFPDRFIQLGLHEQDMVSTAAGLAASGLIPFATSFVVFLSGIPWIQIRQSVCLSHHNVKLVASHGGITVGEDGASHQGCEDFALMSVLPHMTVICPADAAETKKAVKAIAEHDGPVYMRLSREKFPVLFDESYHFKIGKARRLQEGEDVSLLGTGLMVYHSLLAAELLKVNGISARVINVSTIKPLDIEEIVKAARETGCIVTAEEHSVIGGLGSLVASRVSKECPVPIEMIGVHDQFGFSGKPEELLAHFHLMPKDIEEAALKVIERKRRR
ncbi:MAG: transketolase family protein [Acidobacteriota bacterium]